MSLTPQRGQKKRIDLTGHRFGRLTVIAFAERSDSGAAKWRCRCECGGEAVVYSQALRNGRTSSCGCFRLEQLRAKVVTHGLTSTPIYVCWRNMRSRCSDPRNKEWANYGGRGIRVVERWQSFENFYADMGERPDGYTLDRIDVDRDYGPGNCRWAVATVQARNKRNTKLVTFRGKTQSLKDWAEDLGINYYTLHSRITKSGWSVEEALGGNHPNG